jgi:hypothetical protein
MTKRENRQSRRRPFRQSADRILVVCGGVRTEPDYFEGMKSSYRNPAVKIIVRKAGVSPVELVELAMSVRDRDNDSFDEVWCVCDVDDFDLTAAVGLAARNDVRLAVSNPCFEVWLLLHFEECMAAMTGYEQLRRRLAKHIPDYDKDPRTVRQVAARRPPGHRAGAGVGAARYRARAQSGHRGVGVGDEVRTAQVTSARRLCPIR